MEYVPLGSLRDYLPKHNVSLAHILLFAQQICEVKGSHLCWGVPEMGKNLGEKARRQLAGLPASLNLCLPFGLPLNVSKSRFLSPKQFQSPFSSPNCL